jgi:asparagine synthetase B (glutamine-hydrolysing)
MVSLQPSSSTASRALSFGRWLPLSLLANGNSCKRSHYSHERLAIVGVDTGAQPLASDDGQTLLCVNGEIYNHRTLRKNLKKAAKFKTHSDCEVILYLVSYAVQSFVVATD